jgi:hypothetical protein
VFGRGDVATTGADLVPQGGFDLCGRRQASERTQE